MSMMHLRPRSFSEIIDATFNIVRARIGPIATIGALMIIPGAIMSLVMMKLLPDVTATSPGTLPTLGPKFWTAWAIIFPISIVVYTLGSTALIAVASATYLGHHADVQDGLAAARRRFWPVIGTGLLKALAIFLPFGVVFALIGGIAASGAKGGSGAAVGAGLLGALLMLVWMIALPIMLLRWAVAVPVTALEHVGPATALGRSSKLTKGSKARLFGLYVVFFVVFFAMYAVGATIGGLTGAIFANLAFAQVLGNVMSMVLYPLLAVLQTVIYYDLRIRNEGFDLEMMASGLNDQAVLSPAGAPTRQPA